MKFRLILSEVDKGLSRNQAVSVTVTLATFASLLFVGIAGPSRMQVMRMKSEWYGKIEVSIHMCVTNDGNPPCNNSEANTERTPQVGAKLKSPGIQPCMKEAYERSKEEAYESLRRFYGDSTIGQWAGADMMQVSFRVKFVDPEQYSIIKEELSGVAEVSEVKDQHEIIESLLKVIDTAHLLALGLGAVTIVAVILLISTTIRLSAMSREQETQITRYMGASNLFIQVPFTIEGALAVVTGALLTVASLFVFVVFLVQGRLQPTLQWTRFIDVREVWIMTPLLILAVVLLALIASAVSLAKYTKM